MASQDLRSDAGSALDGWRRGLPPGPLTDQMIQDYEVYFSPGGQKWHRRKQPPVQQTLASPPG